MIVTLAAPAGRQIEFKVGGAAGDPRDCLERFRWQGSATEIGVQDRTGQVEDRSQRIGHKGLQPCRDGLDKVERGVCSDGFKLRSACGQHFAHD